MAVLTVDQLADFRADIADEGGSPAFSDAELQRLYARTAEDYDGAVRLARRQLWANAAKFSDYTAGLSGEKRDQIFQHLKTLVEADGGGMPRVTVGALTYGDGDDDSEFA